MTPDSREMLKRAAPLPVPVTATSNSNRRVVETFATGVGKPQVKTCCGRLLMLKGILPYSSREKTQMSDLSKPERLLTCRMLREQLQPQLQPGKSHQAIGPIGFRSHCDMTNSGTSPLEATVLKGGLDPNWWTAVWRRASCTLSFSYFFYLGFKIGLSVVLLILPLRSSNPQTDLIQDRYRWRWIQFLIEECLQKRSKMHSSTT